MYQEEYTKHNNTTLFQITRINQRDTLIVFLHGIGDSHLNMLEFFNSSKLKKYDMFVTDLLGHGCSGSSLQDDFSAQVSALTAQLLPLVPNYKHVILVPHSMGGIHATLLAKYSLSKFITGIFAIETAVTQYGSFIAERVYTQMTNGAIFHTWFQAFCAEIYAVNTQIYRQYYAGLQFVREKTFLKNAMEMHALAHALKSNEFTHEIGELFTTLPIAKVYCLGEKGQQLSSVPFLKAHGMQIEYFPTNCHWVAQACFKDFCQRLGNFIDGLS